MSWALSCLSLRKYYNNIVLYTDSEGYRILIEKLKLPYSDVVVQYDNLPCLPQHWAYSKVMTYSLQHKPFLHVDSDFYLTQRLPKRILEAKLVAQNGEYGTSYYKNMVDNLFNQTSIKLPNYLNTGLRMESIPSFNMGLFGGHDLNFIRQYCQEIFSFFDENNLNNTTNKDAVVYCNVIFEQIFFAIMVKETGLQVESLLNRNIQDNGYTVNDFCNLTLYKKKSFFHLIGGHKKNKFVCESLERALMRTNPECYENIIRLFPLRHRRLAHQLHITGSDEECMLQYENFIRQQEDIYKDLPFDKLFKQEQNASHYSDFLNASKGIQRGTVFIRHPQLSIFRIPKEWPQHVCELLRKRFPSYGPKEYSEVAVIPILTESGLREVCIDDATYNILALLDTPKRFDYLQKDFQNCFSVTLRNQREKIIKCFSQALSYLLFYGMITIETDGKQPYIVKGER